MKAPVQPSELVSSKFDFFSANWSISVREFIRMTSSSVIEAPFAMPLISSIKSGAQSLIEGKKSLAKFNISSFFKPRSLKDFE